MTRRLHLLLDEKRYERVLAAAEKQGVSVATVIRDAIDEGVTDDRPDKRAAFEAILAAEPMEVPEGDGLVEEIRQLRDERLSDLP